MSNAVSALEGRISQGDVIVRELGLRGMITVRCDHTVPELAKACRTVVTAAFPNVGQVHMADADHGIAWMSPDEVLIMVPHADAEAVVAKLNKALAKVHALVVNVSDARAVLAVDGPFAREVIAKLAPADLHPDRFKKGMMRRTRLGQVAAAFWMVDDETFHVICFRSVGEYTFKLLAASACAGRVGFLDREIVAGS